MEKGILKRLQRGRRGMNKQTKVARELVRIAREISGADVVRPITNENIEYAPVDFAEVTIDDAEIGAMGRGEYNSLQKLIFNLAKQSDGMVVNYMMERPGGKNEITVAVPKGDGRKFLRALGRKWKGMPSDVRVAAGGLDELKSAIGAAKNFMDVGKQLKAVGLKYTFSTEPLAIYMVKIGGSNYAVVNKKHADDPDFVVGQIAVGKLGGSSYKVVDFDKAIKDVARRRMEVVDIHGSFSQSLFNAKKAIAFLKKQPEVEAHLYDNGDIAFQVGEKYPPKLISFE